ncbi:helix-turn-helix domain-containing protein [Chryseobacterium kwangjuense]|uniref:HTH araC/xylS-type domain-containing protein n=1 Tax=Chryseobacterium kwangjuense TaxID=267125 RepID=A0A135W454_9FLAO|nr:helix-turn-helix domain-containing protein [Chryseobacterium kwangjuense]KXH79711.1 hypothetical protein AU378_20345 [Chryseobacterium kwangjuense]
MKGYFTLFFLLLVVFSFSQTQKEIDVYKSKFFLFPTIGTDSSLIYVNKIFSSKRPVDLAFAYTAKRYLETITGNNNQERNYQIKIDQYLKQVPGTSVNYADLSNIYNILGNTELNKQKYDLALEKFIQAEYYAQNNHDTKQTIKIKGNIALIKLELRKTDEAIAEIKNVLFLMDKNKKIYQKENYTTIRNNNLLNLSHLYINKFIDGDKRNKAYLDSSYTEVMKVLHTSDHPSIIADANLKIGTILVYRNNRIKAVDYYGKSLAIFESLNLKNEILNVKYNIAINYFELNKLREAKKLFLELSATYKKDPVINLDRTFTQYYLSKIYIVKNNSDSAAYYSNSFIELYDKNTEKEKEDILKIYKLLNEKDLKTEIDKIKKENSERSNKWLIIITVLTGCIFCIIGYVVWQWKRKKQLKKQIDHLITNVKTQTEKESIKNATKISNEKEFEIIEKLLNLEKKKFYLENEFNLVNVAKKIGTNTAYLSQAINNSLGKTFSEYSNELKINYILKELAENRKIRGYTTQALAEMVGYKNGTSFAKSFKEKTGVTPFQYIDKLNKE